MSVTRKPGEPVTLDVATDDVKLDLAERGITVPIQHQAWRGFRKLTWGNLSTTPWERF